MTLRAMLPWDVRLQVRYGFYAVYVVLVIAFAAVLRSLPAGPARETGLLLVLFADPSFLGFYFVAALVLFEKGQGVVGALVTSPLSTRAYLWSKALSLTLLALVATTVVTAFGYGTGVRWLPLLVGVALTSVLFVFVGFVAVARFDSINAYFMTALAYMTVLGAPVLGLLGIVETRLFYLLPARPSLVLFEAAVGPVSAPELVYAVGYLLLAIGVAAAGARRSFERHVVAGLDQPGSDRPPVGSRVGGEYGPVLSLAVADLKNWVRDPLLVYIGLAPVLLGVVGRYGVPYVADTLAGRLDLAAYYPEVVAGLALFGPSIIGFAVGFLILEDREQGTFTAVRLTPLTGRGYLAYRLGVTVLVSFVAALVVVPLLDLVTVPALALVAVSGVAALYGAVTALFLSGLADNTIEGIAVSKFLGFLVMVPVAVIAVVPAPYQHLAGVLPAYWPALGLVAASGRPGSLPAALVVGVVYQAVVLAVLGRRFLARSG
jgi:hypothetical protein